MDRKRRVDYDIIRSLAIILVIFSHALGVSPFYFSVNRAVTLFMGIVANKVAVLCVPLFILLTGALCHKKTDYVSYYKKQIPILISYIFWTFIVTLFHVFYLKQEFSPEIAVSYFFGYGSQDRCWYLNLYFGLALLIPFLNIVWNNINFNAKKVLIVVLMLLGPISNLVKLIALRFNISVVFISSYFTNVWIITYYYIGAFINEYEERISRKKAAIGFAVLLSAQVVLYFVAASGKVLSTLWIQTIYHYVSPTCIILASLLFRSLSGIQLQKKWLVTGFTVVSKISFDMYLVSVITDTLANEIFGVYYGKMPCLFIVFMCTMFSFVTSFILAWIKNKIYDRKKYGNS